MAGNKSKNPTQRMEEFFTQLGSAVTASMRYEIAQAQQAGPSASAATAAPATARLSTSAPANVPGGSSAFIATEIQDTFPPYVTCAKKCKHLGKVVQCTHLRRGDHARCTRWVHTKLFCSGVAAGEFKRQGFVWDCEAAGLGYWHTYDEGDDDQDENDHDNENSDEDGDEGSNDEDDDSNDDDDGHMGNDNGDDDDGNNDGANGNENDPRQSTGGKSLKLLKSMNRVRKSKASRIKQKRAAKNAEWCMGRPCKHPNEPVVEPSTAKKKPHLKKVQCCYVSKTLKHRCRNVFHQNSDCAGVETADSRAAQLFVCSMASRMHDLRADRDIDNGIRRMTQPGESPRPSHMSPPRDCDTESEELQSVGQDEQGTNEEDGHDDIPDSQEAAEDEEPLKDYEEYEQEEVTAREDVEIGPSKSKITLKGLKRSHKEGLEDEPASKRPTSSRKGLPGDHPGTGSKGSAAAEHPRQGGKGPFLPRP